MYDLETKEIALKQIMDLDKLEYRFTDEDGRRSADRDQFQRDYTRVMYSSSFRRLQGKMQLLGLHNDKFFRNRLTHSLEVSQIARAIAENLGYTKTYAVETAALAHDIGNPPFGHYGERVLKKIAEDFGGYEGNAQTLRVLTTLEKKNPQTRGLNLTIRSLLAVTKYFVKPEYVFEQGQVRPSKFIYPDDYQRLKDYIEINPLKVRTLDAQIMDLADEIAYAAHDLEDGLSMKLFTIEDVDYEYRNLINIARTEGKDITDLTKGYDVFESIVNSAKDIAKAGNTFRSSEEYELLLRKEILGNVVNKLITQIKFCELTRIKKMKYGSTNDFELGFFDVGSLADNLKEITFKCVNRSGTVQIYEKQGETILRSLYEVFMDEKFNKNNILLPPEYRRSDNAHGGRPVIDYLSGMMDSYAIALYKKYFGENSLEQVYQEYKSATTIRTRG